jgi:hypothetical protein
MRILWLLGQILIVGMRFKFEVGISSPALFSLDKGLNIEELFFPIGYENQ